ncbi:uncharacterized protein LOC132931813 isoform X1 [Rhopalosiphum padi]|uniref:uncharacterized protein LOC132931813 isoform X1 n=2 Tax=Rhopalosiphum padi TaxID=40932 RepID=UPI00298E3312|nr:uncharacterized protein LOC132931813 isoform X1 [Rhopalosiphum padi]
MEAPSDHNQDTQEESLLGSSNEHMEQFESDSVRQRICQEEVALEKLKYIFRRCKTLLEKSKDHRLDREANLMLYSEFRAPLCTPNQVRTSSLNTLEGHPLMWATYIRGNNDDSSSKYETSPMKQPGTFKPSSSRVTKYPEQKKKLRSKMLASSRKMSTEKFMAEFYQFMLTKL